MVSSEHFDTLSTADIPRTQRLRRWNDFGSETLASMAVDPADRDGFKARITRRPLGKLGVTWMTSTPARASSLSTGVSAWAMPGRDGFLLLVQEWGRSCLWQAGREAVLGPGDIALQNTALPWLHEAIDPIGMMVIKLPRQALVSRLSDPDSLAAVVLKRTGAAAFASSVLLSLRRTLDEEPEGEWGEGISDVILDVLEMACARPAQVTNSAERKRAQRREMCSYVEAHLSDPDLRVHRIAAAMGVGVRYLERLCLEAGTTPRQYVLEKRLEAGAERLAVRGRQESVTDIAYSIGFSDLSYFSRTFAKKYGVSPRDFRRGAAPRR